MDTLDKILLLLKENKVEQKDLAQHLGLSHNTVSQWKKGQSRSYLKYIGQIAAYFNVSTDYLLREEKENSTISNTSSLDGEYIFIAGKNGIMEKRYIPSDKLDQIKKIIDALLPEDEASEGKEK